MSLFAEIQFLTIEQLATSQHKACWSAPRHGNVTSYAINVLTSRGRDSLQVVATGVRQCVDLRVEGSQSVSVRIRAMMNDEEGVERRLLYDRDSDGGNSNLSYRSFTFWVIFKSCVILFDDFRMWLCKVRRSMFRVRRTCPVPVRLRSWCDARSCDVRMRRKRNA